METILSRRGVFDAAFVVQDEGNEYETDNPIKGSRSLKFTGASIGASLGAQYVRSTLPVGGLGQAHTVHFRYQPAREFDSNLREFLIGGGESNSSGLEFQNYYGTLYVGQKNSRLSVSAENYWDTDAPNTFTMTLALNGDFKLYHNGVFVKGKPGVTANLLDMSPLEIGRDNRNNGHRPIGIFDDFKALNKTLTAAEVAELYSDTYAGAENFLAEYDFEDGAEILTKVAGNKRVSMSNGLGL